MKINFKSYIIHKITYTIISDLYNNKLLYKQNILLFILCDKFKTIKLTYCKSLIKK